MASWSASQGQPPLYTKYGTVPGRHPSHMYQEKQHPPDFEQYLRCWTVPGSRTGGVLQDYTNWTEPQVSNFPVASQSCSQEIKGYQRREREWKRAEMDRAQKECESRSRMQREGWRMRGEPRSPVRYRRDGKRSLSDNSYHELEAWATRYCHSLPRKRRLEAELWGTQGVQEVQEREMAPEWVSRGGSVDRQSALYPLELHQHMGGWGQGSSRPPAPHVSQPSIFEESLRKNSKENESYFQQSQPPLYIPPPPYGASHNIPGMQQPQKYEMKDNIGYTDSVWEYHHTQKYKYCTLPASRKQEFHGDLGNEKKPEEWKKKRWSDLDYWRGQNDYKAWKGPPAPLSLRPDGSNQAEAQRQTEIMANPNGVQSTEVHGSDKTKPKKKTRGETVFCLISRLGGVTGLSTSPEEPLQSHTLSMSTVPVLTDKVCEGAEKLRMDGSVEGNTYFQLADEVDSEVPQLQHQCIVFDNAPQVQILSPNKVDCNSSKAAPAWVQSRQASIHRDELVKAIQCGLKNQARYKKCQSYPSARERNESMTGGSMASVSPIINKKAQKTCGPVLAKYPLWKEPSHVIKTRHNPSRQCLQENKKPNYEKRKHIGNAQDEKSNSYSDYLVNHNKQGVPDHNTKEDKASDRNSCVLIIDATCVVVRAEFIYPPKKEFVQYLCLPHDKTPGSLGNLAIEINQNNAISDTSSHDLFLQGTGNGSQIPESHSQKPNNELNQKHFTETDADTDLSNSAGNHKTGDMDECSKSHSVIPVNESLEERTLRILGIAQLESNIQKSMLNESHHDLAILDIDSTQQFTKETLSVELGLEATKERGQIEKMACLLDTDSTSENQIITNEEKVLNQERKEASRKEEGFNSPESSSQNLPEKEAIVSLTGKQEPICEHICTENTIPHSHLNQEELIQSEETKPPSQCFSPTEGFDSPLHAFSNCQSLLFPLPPSISPCLTPSLLSHSLPQNPTGSCSSSEYSLDSCTDDKFSPDLVTDIRPLSDSIHFPSCPSSPVVSSSVTSSPPVFDSTLFSGCQSTELKVTVSPPPQSLQPLHTEEHHYPKSLWDAVNRIRRHTAPDSENEEEEGGELWENLENMSEEARTNKDILCLDKEQNALTMEQTESPEVPEVAINNFKGLTDETEENVSLEGGWISEVSGDVSMEDKIRMPEEEDDEEELEWQIEDDTLSCSSSDSHTSRDTVIMGRDGETQEQSEETREETGDKESWMEADMKKAFQNDKEQVWSNTEELLGVIPEENLEENGSNPMTLGMGELCPVVGYVGKEVGTVRAGETVSESQSERDSELDGHRDLVIDTDVEGRMGSLVFPSALGHISVEEKNGCATVELEEIGSFCSDGEMDETKYIQCVEMVEKNKESSGNTVFETLELITYGGHGKKEVAIEGDTSEQTYQSQTLPAQGSEFGGD